MVTIRYWLILGLLFIAACSANQVVCNEPYILVGEDCCLDSDANGICDRDEQEPLECEDQIDCSTCPPNIITETETVEITKYVCSDGVTTVDDIDDCADAMTSPEPIFTPITTNEDDQPVINEFSVRPACRGGYQAIEIYLDVGSTFNELEIQAKTEPDAPYETLFSFDSTVYTKYLYGVFCEGQCTENADFFIDPNDKYLLRGKFDFTNTWDRSFTSNEHIVDATADGAYGSKLC